MFNHINFKEKKIEKSDFLPSSFEYPLYAKSEKEKTLAVHSIEVAMMMEKIVDSLVLTEIERDDYLLLGKLSAIFHDIGKSAPGFQDMITDSEIKKWPKEIGGYRHEILSGVFFNLLLRKTNKITDEEKRLISYAIVTHHKVFKGKEDYYSFLPIIDENQWPVKVSFKKMYKEFLLN